MWQMILLFCKMLPCPGCRWHALMYIQAHPLGDDFWLYTVEFHNAVNERDDQGKVKRPTLTLDQAEAAFLQTCARINAKPDDFLFVYWVPLIYTSLIMSNNPQAAEQMMVRDFFRLWCLLVPFGDRACESRTASAILGEHFSAPPPKSLESTDQMPEQKLEQIPELVSNKSDQIPELVRNKSDQIPELVSIPMPISFESKEAALLSVSHLYNSVAPMFGAAPMTAPDLKARFMQDFSPQSISALQHAESVVKSSNEAVELMKRQFAESKDFTRFVAMENALKLAEAKCKANTQPPTDHFGWLVALSVMLVVAVIAVSFFAVRAHRLNVRLKAVSETWSKNA